MGVWTIWIGIMHLMFSSWAQPPSPTVIDRIEAVVEGRPITLSDVELEKSLARLSPSVFSPFETRRKQPLQFLIEIQLLRHLAGDVPLYQPNEQEIRKRTKIIYDQLETQPMVYAYFMMKHAVNDDRLARVIKNVIIAEKYAIRNLGKGSNESANELAERYRIWIERIKANANFQYAER